MQAAQTVQDNPPTAESVWAFFQELGKKQEELRKSQEETSLQMKETDRLIRELRESQRESAKKQEETDRLIERVTKQMGGLHNSLGELIETLFASHLGEKFDAYNYNLRQMRRRVPIYDDDNQELSDIDILLLNTTVCMAVEVKRWLETEDQVNRHIKRMQLIKQYPPIEVRGKKLLGAIVGAAVKKEAREYAEQNGFFVLELKGENVRLLKPPEGFVPKEW